MMKKLLMGVAPSGVEWWLDDPAVAGLVTVSFLDGAAKAALTRSYSSGVALGELPELEKDGAKFLGWFTAPDGAGTKVTAATTASSSVKTLYAAWQALSVAISPASATLGAGAGNGSFTVTANDALGDDSRGDERDDLPRLHGEPERDGAGGNADDNACGRHDVQQFETARGVGYRFVE